MKEFSFNTEFENLIKVTLTDQEQQQQTEEMNGTGKIPQRISKKPRFLLR